MRIPERYVFEESNRIAEVENALIGDVNAVMDPNVYRRDKLLISLYKRGTPAPYSLDNRKLEDVLREVEETYAAQHVAVDEASLRQVGGRGAILIRSERPTLVVGTFLAQEALVVTKKGVVSILSEIDIEFIPADIQRATFDSILDSIQFQ